MTDQERVIVAGAGPVGLATAVALADMGVPVTVLEKRPRLTAASKASTFHPATLEILDALGVIEPVLAEGRIIRSIQYRTIDDGIIAEFDMGMLAADTRYPFRLHLEQSRVTPLLLERLKSQPEAEVLFDAEVVDVEGAADGVAVVTDGSGGRMTIKGRYLIAADGAHSAIRRSAGIAFDGSTYATKVLRLMTGMDLARWLPNLASVTYVFHRGKSVSLLEMPDCWRIILRIPAEIDDALALSHDWMLARLQEVLPMARELPPLMMTDVYAASKRVASAYRAGPILLAGDSVHVTNTRGGMNMNCGIHDAYCLASAVREALATGDDGPLDRYARDRRQVATDALIPRTDRTVSDAEAWLQTVQRRAGDGDEARAFLAQAAMLDIAPRPFADAPRDGAAGRAGR